MNRILEQIDAVLPPDKAKHLVVGAAVSAVAAAVVAAAGGAYLAAIAGVVAATVVGVWKELADEKANEVAIAQNQFPPHEVSGADALVTLAGGVVAVLPLLVAVVRHG